MATKKTPAKKTVAKTPAKKAAVPAKKPAAAKPPVVQKAGALKAGAKGKAVGRMASSYVGVRGAHVTFEAEQGEQFVVVRFTYADKARGSMSAERFLQNFEVAK
jgi:hypothetical protein